MSRYAIVESGVVTNVIIWDGQGDFFPSMTVILLLDDSQVGPGYTYDGTTFTAPPSPPPPTGV